MKISKISKIVEVANLKSVFVAENNRLIDGNWVSEEYSKREKRKVEKYIINQQYSAELGGKHGNIGNTINACRTAGDSTVKVVNISYTDKGNNYERSVSFVGNIETCHWNLQIGLGSAILNILDNHNTRISKEFVRLFENVYGEILEIKVASIEIDKNISPLLNAVKIEEFRYASQWCYYSYSNPQQTWENAVEAFSHL
jgi:hypothetical protein